MANNLKLLPQAERLLSGQLQESINETVTEFEVSNPPAEGLLPTFFELDPDSDSLKELVRVYGVSGNTITVERGLNNGGVGFAHSSLATYKQKFTSRHYQAVVSAIESGYLLEDASYTFTKVSNNSFKVTASGVDRTDHYTAGRLVRLNGTLVTVIVSSSYANPDTTIVVESNSVPATITTVELQITTKGTDAIMARTKDEDNMASNSDTSLATQQSIKAYVDTNVANIITPTNNQYSMFNNSMSRQAIINGNFDVWQRSVSQAVSTGSTVYFTADRWYDFGNVDGGTFPTLTRSRQLLTSGDIANAFYHTRLATNGAGSSFGNNAYHYLVQRIEHGTRMLCGNGKKVTVSFWARSDIANKRIGVALQQRYGTGGSPSTNEVIAGEIIELTSTWTKYTHTFTTNTLSGKTFGTDNNDYIGLLLYNMWGTTVATEAFSGGTAETFVGSGNIDIAQVQLCAGDVALPFMPKSYEEELRACQRYFYNIPLNDYFFPAITVNPDTDLVGTIDTPVEMRTNPTLNWSATSNGFMYGRALTKNLSAGVNVTGTKQGNHVTFSATVATGANTFCPGWIKFITSASLSAEL